MSRDGCIPFRAQPRPPVHYGRPGRLRKYGMGSPHEERGKRGSLSGPHGSILRKTLARAASDRATSGGRRMFHLGNERSKTDQGSKPFVHPDMLAQPYAASSLFAAANNFTVGSSWPCRFF